MVSFSNLRHINFHTILIILFSAIITEQNNIYGQWSTKNLSTPRSQLCACAHGSKIYFAGGKIQGSQQISDVVDILDVNTGNWTIAHLDKPKRQLQCEVVGDKIFFVGNGQSYYNSSVMDIYDTLNDTWTIKIIPDARGGRIASNGNKIYLAAYNDLDVYDIDTDTWKQFTISPSRVDMGMVSLNDKIILAGGNYFGTDYNTINIFDVNNETWTIDALPIQREALTGQVFQNKAYFGTEESSDGIESYSYIHIYDDVSGQWSLDSLVRENRFRIGQTQHQGKIFYAGGQVINFSNQLVEPVDIFDCVKENWSTIEMPTGRRNLAVVGLNDKIYFAGGQAEDDITSNFYFSDIVEIYDLNDCTHEEYLPVDTLFEYSLIKAKNLISTDYDVSLSSNSIVRWYSDSIIQIGIDFCVPLGAELELSIDECESNP